MKRWNLYRKPGTTEMRSYVHGEDMAEISVSGGDNPELTGGMIARNQDNHEDQWFIAREYFKKNYEAV